MEPMEREDSSTYVNQQPQKTEVHEEPRPVTPAEPPKKKKGKAALILSLLLLLALLAVAAFAWLWYQKSGEVDNVRADLSSTRNKVAQLESAAKAEAALDESDAVTTDTANGDSEAAVKAALAYMQAPVEPLSNLEARVEYLKDGFAKVVVTNGSAGSGAPAFSVTMKESNEDWIVFSAAEGPVADMNELMEVYGIPREAF